MHPLPLARQRNTRKEKTDFLSPLKRAKTHEGPQATSRGRRPSLREMAVRAGTAQTQKLVMSRCRPLPEHSPQQAKFPRAQKPSCGRRRTTANGPKRTPVPRRHGDAHSARFTTVSRPPAPKSQYVPSNRQSRSKGTHVRGARQKQAASRPTQTHEALQPGGSVSRSLRGALSRSSKPGTPPALPEVKRCPGQVKRRCSRPRLCWTPIPGLAPRG